MKSRANVLLLASLINTLIYGVLWCLYRSRNEENLFYAVVASLAIGSMLFLTLVVLLFVVKDTGFRRSVGLTLLAGLSLLSLGGYASAAFLKFRFSRDRVALEKAVAEVCATGQSSAWESLAYDMRVYPRMGTPTVIDFGIAQEKGRDCQWYRWTAKEHPTPDTSSKVRAASQKKKWKHYWLAAHWSVITSVK